MPATPSPAFLPTRPSALLRMLSARATATLPWVFARPLAAPMALLPTRPLVSASTPLALARTPLLPLAASSPASFLILLLPLSLPPLLPLLPLPVLRPPAAARTRTTLAVPATPLLVFLPTRLSALPTMLLARVLAMLPTTLAELPVALTVSLPTRPSVHPTTLPALARTPLLPLAV